MHKLRHEAITRSPLCKTAETRIRLKSMHSDSDNIKTHFVKCTDLEHETVCVPHEAEIRTRNHGSWRKQDTKLAQWHNARLTTTAPNRPIWIKENKRMRQSRHIMSEAKYGEKNDQLNVNARRNWSREDGSGMRNYRCSKTYRYRSANRFRSEAAVVPGHFSKTLVEEMELPQPEEGNLGAESGKK